MNLLFNIIITNKNKTAIAPTYIVKKRKAKNSFSKKSKKQEAKKKQAIKLMTA